MPYESVHRALRLQHGLARDHTCACGRQAYQWAYQHTDPDEEEDERGRPYSEDLSHYKPMCRSCHAKMDLGRRSPLTTHPYPPRERKPRGRPPAPKPSGLIPMEWFDGPQTDLEK